MQSDVNPFPPGLRVLLVEDEPLIAMDGEAALLALGVGEVILARNVGEGLRALELGNVHAAMLDLRLGEESGIAIARRLHELGIPFGFLTGYRGDAIPDEFKDRPILSKPFAGRQLRELLLRLTGT